ncbi:transposase [Candidatus Peregrinibacteria bacterium]|nr:MAG: transposase [Candidatus Peregrinibacteria bacterium]
MEPDTKIKAVLTDNGSEFLAYFHKACQQQGIEHFFTRPRTPKDNAICERFNLTLQQHLYWRVDLTSPIYKINEVLADWLVEYNCLRPHESLNMRPPVAHYFHLFYSPSPHPRGVLETMEPDKELQGIEQFVIMKQTSPSRREPHEIKRAHYELFLLSTRVVDPRGVEPLSKE